MPHRAGPPSTGAPFRGRSTRFAHTNGSWALLGRLACPSFASLWGVSRPRPRTRCPAPELLRRLRGEARNGGGHEAPTALPRPRRRFATGQRGSCRSRPGRGDSGGAGIGLPCTKRAWWEDGGRATGFSVESAERNAKARRRLPAGNGGARPHAPPQHCAVAFRARRFATVLPGLRLNPSGTPRRPGPGGDLGASDAAPRTPSKAAARGLKEGGGSVSKVQS